MIAAVGLRVGHWAELDSPRFRLMYDSDDRKKVESRGTEAVINALVLAGWPGQLVEAVRQFAGAHGCVKPGKLRGFSGGFRAR
jgi:hypothetical protein